MANLLSPGTAFAGLFSDAILSSTGAPVVSTPVTVYQSDGTTVATLYAGYDKTGGTATNPVDTDAYGNLVFYTDPGQYVLGFTVASTPVTVTTTVNPWFTDAAWNVILDTAGLTAISGDSILASAAGGAITETLPSPYLGARVQVTKTDDSANLVTVSATGGAAIFAVGQSSGSTYLLPVQGSSVELVGNGSDWYVVNSAGRALCRVHQTAPFASASASIAIYDTVDFDSVGAYDVSTGMYTVVIPGKYRVTGTFAVVTSASTQYMGLAVALNGSATAHGPYDIAAAASQTVSGYATDLINCAVGNTLSLLTDGTAGLPGVTASFTTATFEQVN